MARDQFSREETMKRISITAAALAAALPLLLAAQSLDQAVANQLNQLSRKIAQTQTDMTLKTEYQGKLQQIAHTARCADPRAKAAAMFDCRMSTPLLLETAKNQAAQLDRDFDKAAKDLAGKTVQQAYQTKLDELKRKIDGGRIDGREAEPLKERIRYFFSSATGGRDRGGEPPSELETRYQQLAADVDAAIKLSADTKSTESFFMQYQQKSGEIDKKIRASKLNPTVRDDLLRDLDMLGASVLRPSRGAAKGSPQQSPSEMAAAMAALDTFNKRVDDTIAADGSKSMMELYMPKLEALSIKLARARIDSTDERALNQRIADLRKHLGEVGKKVGPTLDSFEADLAKLTMEIDAAIALNAERGKSASVLAAFEMKWKNVDRSIKASPLNPLFKSDFTGKLQDIANKVRCGKGLATASGELCNAREVDYSKLAGANTELDTLANAINKAIADYGSKSMRDIYAASQKEQTERLAKSRVPGPDRMRLEQRLSQFMRELDGGGPRSSQTPDTIKASFQMIVADIDAAIRLSESVKTK
jgi:hypothetical protein